MHGNNICPSASVLHGTTLKGITLLMKIKVQYFFNHVTNFIVRLRMSEDVIWASQGQESCTHFPVGFGYVQMYWDQSGDRPSLCPTRISKCLGVYKGSFLDISWWGSDQLRLLKKNFFNLKNIDPYVIHKSVRLIMVSM